jgi:hypothetical protein
LIQASLVAAPKAGGKLQHASSGPLAGFLSIAGRRVFFLFKKIAHYRQWHHSYASYQLDRRAQ